MKQMKSLTIGDTTYEIVDEAAREEIIPSAVSAALEEAKASGDILTGDDKAEIVQMAAEAVEIPEKLPNPNMLTFKGAVTGSYDGSSAKTVNIPTVPSALKNPEALTINGTLYDGSKAVTVNIEGGGGSGGDTVYAKIVYNAETGENTSTMTAAEMVAAYRSGCTVVVVVATSGDVIDVREGSAVLAPYGNNTLLADIITETDKYRVLVECTDSSNPENGRIVVQPFRMGAQSLVGTTAETTPSQVAKAVTEGRPVCISHTDEYGSEYQFTSFNVVDNIVTSESLFMAGYSDGEYVTVLCLKGRLGDNERWFFDDYLRMATVEGLPTALPNPYALTINGKVYDGSKAVAVNIVGGDTDADWIATSEQIGGAPVFNAVDLPFTWSSYFLSMNDKSFHVNVGVEYDVDWEGTKYVCTPFEASGELFFGNADLQAFESVKEHPLSNKNAPFLFGGSGDTITMVTKNSTAAENIDISVTTHAYTVYNKLPKEYLPDDIGGNIDVTAEVGQTIVVEEVDGSGKPTKWRAAEYPLTVNEIIPQTTYTSWLNSDYGCYMWTFEISSRLVPGQEYTVIFDGVEYTRTAKNAMLNNMLVTYIGNTVLLGDNTGEPFTLFVIAGMAGMTIANFDGNKHNVSLSRTTLAEKYVPLEAYPYYIEATATWNGQMDNKPTNYVFHNSVEDVMNAYKSGRDIKLRVSLTNTDALCDAIYSLCGGGARGAQVFMFTLPASTYQNAHWEAIALTGSFSAALLIAANEDGTWGIYEY